MRGNLKTRMLFMAVIIFILAVVVQSVFAFTGEPGSEEDPIVTLSYLKSQISELESYIGRKINDILDKGVAIEQPQTSFVVKQLFKGEGLIGDEGTELILRSGEATAVGNIDGDGVSDVTLGVDLKMGEKINRNHLLIVPRKDGRGIVAKTDSWIMVKGKYEIK